MKVLIHAPFQLGAPLPSEIYFISSFPDSYSSADFISLPLSGTVITSVVSIEDIALHPVCTPAGQIAGHLIHLLAAGSNSIAQIAAGSCQAVLGS
jgi:hypothetical protein